MTLRLTELMRQYFPDLEMDTACHVAYLIKRIEDTGYPALSSLQAVDIYFHG